MLFLMTRDDEEGGDFVYGLDRDHHTMLTFDEKDYLGYLMWTDNPNVATGKREPVLRQLFVRTEYRSRGVATGMVQTWADRFAFPLASSFGVEAPNAHTQRMLVRLGFANRDGAGIIGTKCWFPSYK
jgi:hypothetical protein